MPAWCWPLGGTSVSRRSQNGSFARALHAISEALRSELAERAADDGNTIRVTIIAPGVVRTELPDTIIDPDARRAAEAYYRSIRDPLQSTDIAEAIVYALEAPPHVNVNEILLRPTSQAG